MLVFFTFFPVNVEEAHRAAWERSKSNRTISSIIQPSLLLQRIHSEVSIKGAVAFLLPLCMTAQEGGEKKEKEQRIISYVWQIKGASIAIFPLCSPHLLIAFLTFQSAKALMKIWWGGSAVLGDGGEGWSEGWLQREDEGRENTLCPYFRAPLGIHSSWSFLFRCCYCRSAFLSLYVSLLCFILSLYLCHPCFFCIFMNACVWPG